MSFGFSVSDLVVGGKLAFDIYQQCFTKAQGAGELQRIQEEKEKETAVHHVMHYPLLELRFAFRFLPQIHMLY